MPSQTESGKAFEYCIAVELSEFLSIPFVSNGSKASAKRSFEIHPEYERDKMRGAADEAAVFLGCHEDGFKHAKSVYLQADQERDKKGCERSSSRA